MFDRVCLQRISKRGHNRDIAQRINPSDYFGVFNSMLASELSILGKIAVGGVLDSNDHDGIQNSNNKKDSEAFNDIDELVSNFKRICTSNAYTYFYAMQVSVTESIPLSIVNFFWTCTHKEDHDNNHECNKIS